MKKLLPILLCYVLATTQAYAISGGPVYGGGGGINPVGVYSGVITVTSVKDFINDPATGAPITDPTTGQSEYKVDTSTVSLGLFSLGVPTINVAQGAFIQFVNGDVYIGTITASVDPDRGSVTGIVQGESSYQRVSSSGVTSTSITVLNSAAGKVLAQISSTRQGSAASARITGSAALIVNSGGNRVTSGAGAQAGSLVQDFSLQCVVTGFRQSTAYSSVGSIGTATGT